MREMLLVFLNTLAKSLLPLAGGEGGRQPDEGVFARADTIKSFAAVPIEWPTDDVSLCHVNRIPAVGAAGQQYVAPNRILSMRSFIAKVCVLISTSIATAADPAEIILWPDGMPEPVVSAEPAETLVKGDDGLTRRFNVSQPRLFVYPPDENTSATGAAVIVVPGGGFGRLADEHEGSIVCRWLASHGIVGIELAYLRAASKKDSDRAAHLRTRQPRLRNETPPRYACRPRLGPPSPRLAAPEKLLRQCRQRYGAGRRYFLRFCFRPSARSSIVSSND